MVKDTRLAFGELAAWVRQQVPTRVVALTGSSGKTSVKEMTAAILSQCGNTLYTAGNLNNDIERAVYSAEERLILINTEAPTVRLYVDGQGRFRDGARLLLAELLLDVIAEELARRYVDRTTQKGDSAAYHQAKQAFVRRYGVEIHQILLGD